MFSVKAKPAADSAANTTPSTGPSKVLRKNRNMMTTGIAFHSSSVTGAWMTVA